MPIRAMRNTRVMGASIGQAGADVKAPRRAGNTYGWRPSSPPFGKALDRGKMAAALADTDAEEAIIEAELAPD